MFTVEKKFTSQKLPCVIIKANIGHLCGYVGVPEVHPLYGKDYSENVKCLKPLVSKKALNGQKPESRGYITVMCMALGGAKPCMSHALGVHGGVTYAGGNDGYPVKTKNPTWWIGFDCAHAGDTPKRCNLAYVTNECKKLAKQLAAFNKREV